MSPILTRPVREQLEHDRVIRQLQAKYKRKTDVIINPGNEQNQSVIVGELVVFPDVLVFAEGTKRLLTTVEVETGESVNPIEARAEWGVYSKLKVPLHLYVPPACVEAAKRISDEYQIVVSELWTYTTSFDQVRFTLVSRSPDAPTVKVPAAAPKPAAKPRPAAKPTPVAKPKPVAKPTSSGSSRARSRDEAETVAKPSRRKPSRRRSPRPRNQSLPPSRRPRRPRRPRNDSQGHSRHRRRRQCRSSG